jgi:uncharacterized protein (TIGR02996 family)
MPNPDLALLLEAARRSDDPQIGLVLADWLEEFGNEADHARAEYIRLDHRARHDPDMAGQSWVEQRLAELRGAQEMAWLGPLATLRGVQRWTLHRGLLWIWTRPAILKRDRLRLLAECASTGWLHGIRCEGWKTRHLRRLFASAHLKGLPALEILHSRGPTPLLDLARNKAVGQLERLRVLHGGVSDGELRRFLESTYLTNVHIFELPFNRLSTRGLVWLSRAALLEQLTELNLEANRIGPRGVVALVESPRLPPLHLKLAFNRVRDRGAVRLARLPGLTRLRSLDLGWNAIGPEGLACLRQSPYLQGELLADGNTLSD